MATDRRQLVGDSVRRQDKIDGVGRDRGARHAGEFCRVFILGEGNAALLLDRLQAQGSIRRRPRQDDPDRLTFPIERQRTEERVDGHVRPASLPAAGEREDPVRDGHVRVGRDHVDMIGLNPHAVLHLDDRLRGRLGQDLRQHALMSGIQMLDQDKGHHGRGWEVPE